MMNARAGSKVADRLRRTAFPLTLALEALLLLSLNDLRTSCALLHLAATCWPGRIGGPH